ncbi:uncharacterized protein PITG_16997 [Phytophthora infestans T30-4]|uniref:Uncharacterized protein n=1 Tax=Phytophthora infestans (strain T30-4) TaxID=403677 RepID=D0NUJ6_PHYIT|nr:uncharacterized protein PITG_16997 [Phytophthora infestans T30-4]EEY65342.1 hypothetical protein PITG_16997 [Phytophthora infestans T30-4]|eukprot:XP_002897205.1 hypothetical protein PITG_16997 [Phytophthora infestans T30-4]
MVAFSAWYDSVPHCTLVRYCLASGATSSGRLSMNSVRSPEKSCVNFDVTYENTVMFPFTPWLSMKSTPLTVVFLMFLPSLDSGQAVPMAASHTMISYSNSLSGVELVNRSYATLAVVVGSYS